ncbi:MAG: hypothetical protein P1V51_01075 [Deltaproteobacteria bacterium]|nr:hypothetical protein [Deltaproteobacteria bacterium]
MSERVSTLVHEGKSILFIDLSGLRGEAMMPVLEEAKRRMQALGDEPLRVLTDVRDAYFTKETKDFSRSLVRSDRNGRSALVGITGVQRIIASAIFRDNYYAKDLEDAKRWLVET